VSTLNQIIDFSEEYWHHKKVERRSEVRGLKNLIRKQNFICTRQEYEAYLKIARLGRAFLLKLRIRKRARDRRLISAHQQQITSSIAKSLEIANNVLKQIEIKSVSQISEDQFGEEESGDMPLVKPMTLSEALRYSFKSSVTKKSFKTLREEDEEYIKNQYLQAAQQQLCLKMEVSDLAKMLDQEDQIVLRQRATVGHLSEVKRLNMIPESFQNADKSSYLGGMTKNKNLFYT